jgi:hypothetical protein
VLKVLAEAQSSIALTIQAESSGSLTFVRDTLPPVRHSIDNSTVDIEQIVNGIVDPRRIVR